MVVEIKPCPFCGKTPNIVVCDYEGNIHSEIGYGEDPWSGLSFALMHDNNDECVVATEKGELLGFNLFDTREEATDMWNKRI